MYLSRLLLSHFKNIGDASLTFSPGINVLYGDNGEGKTNLLDGLYYLSVCKSSMGIPDLDVIGYDHQETTLFGEYDMGNAVTEKISCAADRQEKRYLNGTENVTRNCLPNVGLILVVMVSPQDTSLVFGSGEERQYLNFLLSQTQPDYLPDRAGIQKTASPEKQVVEIGPHSWRCDGRFG